MRKIITEQYELTCSTKLFTKSSYPLLYSRNLPATRIEFYFAATQLVVSDIFEEGLINTN